MVPSWIVILSAIELIGFLAVALGIATAAPEEVFIRVVGQADLKKTR